MKKNIKKFLSITVMLSIVSTIPFSAIFMTAEIIGHVRFAALLARFNITWNYDLFLIMGWILGAIIVIASILRHKLEDRD